MDMDLGGDDVKLVGYSIIFTKRAAEAVLQAEREEIVHHATNAASFAGLKVAEFLQRVERDGIQWPLAWNEPPGDGYPAVGQPIRQIPPADQKYVTLAYLVKLRRPISDPEREEDAAVLRRIRERLI